MYNELIAIANNIRIFYNKSQEGLEAWREYTMKLANELLKGKEAHKKQNEAFGKWIIENKLDFINEKNRAALINMATYSEISIEALKNTNRISWRHIWENDILPKAKPSPAHLGGTKITKENDRFPKEKSLRQAALNSEGISNKELQDEFKVSDTPVRTAKAWAKGFKEGQQHAIDNSPIDTSALNETYKAKFEALERRLRVQIEFEVQQGIEKHMREYVLPHYGDKLRKAEMIIANAGKKTPLSNAEYLLLMKALHPDSSSQEYRNEAFIMLKNKEVLLRPEEKEFKLTSRLPTTLEELKAMKKTGVTH